MNTKPVYNGAPVPAEYTFQGTTKKLVSRLLVAMPEDESDFVAEARFTFGGVEVPADVVSHGGLDPAQEALVDDEGKVLRNQDPKFGRVGDLEGEVLHAPSSPADPIGAWDRFIAAHPELAGLAQRGICLVQE